MVVETIPKVPATSRQLWRLHELTSKDTRTWDLSMQEASDMIDGLQRQGVPQALTNNKVNEAVSVTGRASFTEVHVTLVEGDQGGGKSNFGVARIRDNYEKDCVRIYCEKVLHIRCIVKSYDRDNRVAKIKHNNLIKLIRIPKEYKLWTPRRVFANIHLYGIQFCFCPSFEHIMKWLKDGTMVDAWLLVDESYVGMNARESMNALGKELEKQYFQLRKMQLDVILITPMARLIDWTLRTIPTEHVHCSYDKRTHKITIKIRKKGEQGERIVYFDGRPYWKNFKTNERITQ